MNNNLIPPQNAHELAVFWTWMGEDGICRTKTKPHAVIDVSHARENSHVVNSFYVNKKYPLLIDSRDVKTISIEARKHFSIGSRETKISAFAILVKSPLSRVIGNFFMGLNKPKVPARLFENETEAILWLKKFMSPHE